MKRLFLFLVVVFLCSGCKNGGGEPKKDSINAKIGDKGPGGGIVFHIDGNKAWEVSDKLGDREWEAAKALCKAYRGGGCDDWYLPTKEELSLVYEALVKTGIIDDKGMYWSSSPSSNYEAWVQHFSDGNQYDYTHNSDYSVRAVRTF